MSSFQLGTKSRRNRHPGLHSAHSGQRRTTVAPAGPTPYSSKRGSLDAPPSRRPLDRPEQRQTRLVSGTGAGSKHACFSRPALPLAEIFKRLRLLPSLLRSFPRRYVPSQHTRRTLTTHIRNTNTDIQESRYQPPTCRTAPSPTATTTSAP